ncbi:MAG: hypothetical protein LAT62_07065 [Natronospirillum sp.]|uniref:hypothetical protein n=1 Tax=Natronospirillum sp. TaxID=2812955 RepID=UPI0025D84029|nr:hypothetical protein [Natronospirillum sp.]MCH8551677.1 hypothetical protein [Natronospirillum sp.]
MFSIEKLNWPAVFMFGFVSFGYVFDYILGVLLWGDDLFGGNLFQGLFTGLVFAFLNLVILSEKLRGVSDTKDRKRKFMIYCSIVGLSLVGSFFHGARGGIDWLV